MLLSTEELRGLVRDVPGFPRPGVVFKDISPLLADPAGLATAVALMAEPWQGQVDVVAGIEARGFILAAPLALALGAGFAPVRKAGKLPGATVQTSYALEYAEAVLEVHRDAVAPGARVLVVDDVLATGGTAAAAVELISTIGGHPVALSVLIELGFLAGRERLPGLPVEAVLAL